MVDDGLIADLTRQLHEVAVAAEEKEQIIVGLKAASDERLLLIQRLDAESRALRAQLEDKDRAYLEVERSAAASLTAAAERLQVIEELSADVRELHHHLAESQRTQTDLERVVKERADAVELLDAELKRCRAQLYEDRFVAQIGVRVVAELQRLLDASPEPPMSSARSHGRSTVESDPSD
jgi:chromosome segregation ATPase